MSTDASTPSAVERCELAPGFSISRVLTGLWQVADMERDRHELDPDAAASAMAPYVEAGFTTFDMADHYGSAEKIAGNFRRRHGDGKVELLTKWVPKPGPITRQDVPQPMRQWVLRQKHSGGMLRSPSVLASRAIIG